MSQQKNALSNKQQYNEILVRFRNAESYLNDKRIPEAKRLKWVPDYLAITDQLNALLQQIGTYTDKEVWEGFK